MPATLHVAGESKHLVQSVPRYPFTLLWPVLSHSEKADISFTQVCFSQYSNSWILASKIQIQSVFLVLLLCLCEVFLAGNRGNSVENIKVYQTVDRSSPATESFSTQAVILKSIFLGQTVIYTITIPQGWVQGIYLFSKSLLLFLYSRTTEAMRKKGHKYKCHAISYTNTELLKSQSMQRNSSASPKNLIGFFYFLPFPFPFCPFRISYVL